MARPRFSLAALVAHILSPRKSPKPTGLRKKKLSGKRSHNKSRVRRYNSWPAEKQAVLDQTGLRDAYFNGEISYREAVQQLKRDAIHVQQGDIPSTVEDLVYSRLNNAVIANLYRQGFRTKDDGGKFDPVETRTRLTMYIPDSLKPQVVSASAAVIKRRAADKSYEIIAGNGKAYNPYWYR